MRMDLAGQALLPAGDDDAVLLAEPRDQRLAIHAIGQPGGGHNIGEVDAIAQYPEAEFRELLAGVAGKVAVAGEDVLHAFGSHERHTFQHSIEHGEGRRGEGLTLRQVLASRGEVPVEARAGGLLGGSPGFGADRHGNDAGRGHEGLLGAGDRHVNAPGVGLEGQRADRADAVHQQEGAAVRRRARWRRRRW